jgi:activator of Hsp90 ATPase-like protein
MTVTAVCKDPQTLSMTLEAEFDASPERVWQLWADPRQLERWWGPPSPSGELCLDENPDAFAAKLRQVLSDRQRR